MKELNVLELSGESLKKALRGGEITVSIIGLGHVGLPLACAWATAGARVIGVDRNESVVSMVNRGLNPVRDEPGLDEIVEDLVLANRLKATRDLPTAVRDSNVVILTIPTGVKWNEPGKPLDLMILREVLEDVANSMGRGKLVVIESTVPPGTTLNIAKPLLEEVSGLRVEEDFGLAYSPERIMSGHAYEDIVENYPKIVSSVGSKSLRAIKALYEVIARKGVIAVSSPIVAEFEKIVEGIYRDVNIALANELAKMAQALRVDFEEVRAAANSQPYCHLHKPGTGVGGYCIPIYPYFAMHVAMLEGLDLPLTRLARIINESMPEYIASLTLKAISTLGLKPGEARVSILGLAFRGDVGDTRLTPTYDLIRHLEAYDINDIAIHDPYAGGGSAKYPLYRSLEDALRERSIIVVATDHSIYKNIEPSKLIEMTGVEKVAIVDGRDIVDFKKLPEKNVVYVGVGRPWIIKL